MQPLEELLHRIVWDAEFGRGSFALGYYDRVLHREIVVPMSALTLSTGQPRTFTFEDEQGVARTVPLHRVRTVYKGGSPIWRRPQRT
ncbi:MAG: DUF504 domain-containing protein [Betaproteobacteria bacterium]